MKKEDIILSSDPDALDIDRFKVQVAKHSAMPKVQIKTRGSHRYARHFAQLVRGGVQELNAVAPQLEKIAISWVGVTEKLNEARTGSARTTKTTTVGLWDLGTMSGDLGVACMKMNKAQHLFRFLLIRAVVPSGILRTPSDMEDWYRKSVRNKPRATDLAEMRVNLLANDFFPIGHAMKKHYGLDQVVGLTSAMVAGEEDGSLYWNYFSTHEKDVALVSAYDMQRYAKESGRSVHAVLFMLIMTQLVVNRFPRLQYHHDDRGCVFDHDGERDRLVDKLKEPRIDETCMQCIPASQREEILELFRLTVKL